MLELLPKLLDLFYSQTTLLDKYIDDSADDASDLTTLPYPHIDLYIPFLSRVEWPMESDTNNLRA